MKGSPRNLVIVRAGDSSLHPNWLNGCPDRNWDLWVSYFGDDPARYRVPDVTRLDSKGPKWPALYELLTRYAAAVERYAYVWLPDDDLDCSGSAISNLFTICSERKLKLAQPALSADSFVNHAKTIHNPFYLLRYTNFVETMAPCFDIEALRKCMYTFNLNLSGWGIDHVWPSLFDERESMAIVDTVQVTHTRPLGGPNYNALVARGVSAYDELLALLKNLRLERTFLRSLGAVDLDGDRVPDHIFQRDINQWLTPPW